MQAQRQALGARLGAGRGAQAEDRGREYRMGQIHIHDSLAYRFPKQRGYTIQQMDSSHYFSSPEGSFDPRPVNVELADRQVRVSTAGGIFSPDGIDKGSAVLLRSVPEPAGQGDLLDVGCGWGPLALTMAMRSPEATVWAVDVNERALDLCARNAKDLGLTNIKVTTPDGVPEDLRFATIWSNPPIRVGKAVLHQILRQWLPRLGQEADAWLVVQKNLGADSLQKWLAAELGEAFSVERPTTSKGFRVLHVVRR